ncbi:MAG TPA: penicillin-binding protein 2 [Thermoflexia bacterium]|jgi:cell division protein FtsI/penicillin-binding protein 2|nr:penicillin-binding protein 2 [Thermoflexia bacterium]
MDERARRRLGLIIFLLALFTLGLVHRLFVVQVVEGATYAQEGMEQRIPDLGVRFPDAPRGRIRERGGLLLATNRVRHTIMACPSCVPEEAVDTLADDLSPILGWSPGEIAALLRGREEGVVLVPDATPEQVEAVERLGSPAVWVEDRWEREYPQKDLTAHVGGFVGYGEKGEGRVGYYGLEGFYDDVLRPRQIPPVEREADGSGTRLLPLEEGEFLASMPGEDLETTIDLAMQLAAMEELERGVQEFQAESGIIIVVDPRTGAILAMAVYPSYDPREYYKYAGDPYLEDLLENPAISLHYEPGSVFKIVTMAAALDSGSVTPDTTYVDPGEMECGGESNPNWDGRSYGVQDMRGVLVHSLNTGVVWLTCRVMDREVFYSYVRAFGFGQRTGVDLDGEVTGIVHYPGDLDWEDAFLGKNAYGQGIAVTPLQMISAVAAVANGGRLMQPYVVERRIQPDGSVLKHQPVVRGQPITPQTAQALTEMLVQVVEEGVPLARVPGYRVAGKTGTAQIPTPWGYDPENTIASFAGFGPVPDPRLAILVRLDRPQASRWGSETAAVVFSRLAARLFPMMGIPPGE